MKSFSVVVARSSQTGGIGVDNRVPWNIPTDREHFCRLTTSGKTNVVIMGKNTWRSLPAPLVNRVNIIVSCELHNRLICNDVIRTANSLDSALELAYSIDKDTNVFVIGGERLYREAFGHPDLESIYITEVSHNETIMYDTRFPDCVPSNFSLRDTRTETSGEYRLTFNRYDREVVNIEREYLGLLRNVLENGETRTDRTGIGTLSTFGDQISFDISERFPLLTSKRVPIRIVFEELMWFLRGQTRNDILTDKNVHIWDGNSSMEYMKRIGLSHYPPGELGPVYGAQWRNFGGEHKFDEERHIATGESGGVDQIKTAIEMIKSDPGSRRILVSAWNPVVLDKVALPPCHYAFQFYVRGEKYLDIKLNMRSNDLFLGAPFNIASYSLLCYMIASMTGYKPGRLIYSVGDAHIYKSHIEQVKLQLSRALRPSPRLEIVNIRDNIEDWEWSDFKLYDYNPHPTIKGEMAV
jgi:dihydrofolate reductase/thymidylate synthase